MIAEQVFTVGTRTHVEAVHPCPRHQFDEVFIAVVVFGEHDEVPSALVVLVLVAVGLGAPCHIHLASEDGFEGFLALFFEFLVFLVAVVEQLFHSHHVAMIGDGHSPHTVADGLVDQTLYAGLSVEQRIVSVYMQVYEVSHNVLSRCGYWESL